jgi:hypothetical protein
MSKHWAWGYFLLMAFFFVATTPTRMRGASDASIITRICSGSLMLLVQQSVAPVVTAQTQSGKPKVTFELLYNQLSDHLIAGAASANGDKDVGDIDNDDPPLTLCRPILTINISPLNPATHLASSGPVKITIPLRILFKYPAESDLPSDEGVNVFCVRGHSGPPS